ncbi:MAG: NADH-ubiquinone oxidoreductase-F iron-sulfur binding region domain-containing protein [Acidobacteriaceae bacterium]
MAIAECLEIIEQCHVRGRAGAGFPVAHKLRMLSAAQTPTRHLICNAHAFGASYIKQETLFARASGVILLSLLVAGRLAGATRVSLCINEDMQSSIARVAETCAALSTESEIANVLHAGQHKVAFTLHLLPPSYVSGEESAVLNSLEGAQAFPQRIRVGPVLSRTPNASAAVFNLESLLQMAYSLKAGVSKYRQYGTSASTGTMLFTVVGDIARPGCYEAPLGTKLGTLVNEMAGGLPSGKELLGVLPGGLGSRVLTKDQLDFPLDYESARREQNTLGTGEIIVMSTDRCPVTITRILAESFMHESCGQCHPCKDGLHRVAAFLNEFESWGDIGNQRNGHSKRKTSLEDFPILNNASPGAPLYTDTASGLEKIRLLCDFFKHRGDCFFSVHAATTIASMMEAFAPHFESHRV